MSRIALMFPGQGAQHPGMGQDLAAVRPEARSVFEAADAALGEPLSELCFSGTPEQLALTENTQPAILTTSVAGLRVLESDGLKAQAAAGHSLGEYSALVAAGTLQFEDAVRAVRQRGRFMQEAVPQGEGAMAAILGLDRDRVESLCAEIARISGEERVAQAANHNGPGQTVIAGHADAVAQVVEAAKEAGARKAVPLPVSAPFHCALMQPAADRLRPVLEAIEFADPVFPVYTNVDAKPITSGDAARDALLRQVASPVRWQELIERMRADGLGPFVEIGPGKVLSGLLRRIDRKAQAMSVGDAASATQAIDTLKGAA